MPYMWYNLFGGGFIETKCWLSLRKEMSVEEIQ